MSGSPGRGDDPDPPRGDHDENEETSTLSSSLPNNIVEERVGTVVEEEDEDEDAYKQEILRLTAVGCGRTAQLSSATTSVSLQRRGGGAGNDDAPLSSETSTTTSERPVSDSSLSVSDAATGTHDRALSGSRNDDDNATRSVPASASLLTEAAAGAGTSNHSSSPSITTSNRQGIHPGLDKTHNGAQEDEQGSTLDAAHCCLSPPPPPPRSFLDRYDQVQEDDDAKALEASGMGSDPRTAPTAPAPTNIPIATASAVRVPSDEFIMVPRSSLMVVPSSLIDPNGNTLSAPQLLVIPSRHFLDGNVLDDRRDDDHDHEVATAVPMDNTSNSDDEIRQLHETIAVLQEQLVVQNELVKSLRQTLRDSAATTSMSTSTSVATTSLETSHAESAGAPVPPSVDGSPNGDKSMAKKQMTIKALVSRRKGSKWMLQVAAGLLLVAALIVAVAVPLTSNAMSASGPSNSSPTYGGEEHGGGSGTGDESPTPSPVGKVVGFEPTLSPAPTVPPNNGDLVPPGQATMNNTTNGTSTDDTADVSNFSSPSPFGPSIPTPAPADLGGASTTTTAATLSAGAVAGISVSALVLASLILLYVAMVRSSSSSSERHPSEATTAKLSEASQAGQGDETLTSRIHDHDWDDDEDDEADVDSVGEWTDESRAPSVSNDGVPSVSPSPSRLSLLQSRVAALQAKVTRRSEQAQQLVALLEQQQQRSHQRQQPRAQPRAQPLSQPPNAGDFDIL